MRRTTILLVAFFLLASRTLTAQEHHHELSAEEVGSVHFVTSCSKTAQPGFNRAVALLHSFQYEQARQAFNEVAALAPSYYPLLRQSGAGREGPDYRAPVREDCTRLGARQSYAFAPLHPCGVVGRIHSLEYTVG